MGNPLRSSEPSDGRPYDAGTLWTMTRDGWTARCTLWALPAKWELRVVVDTEPLFFKRSTNVADLFSLAEQWKERMTEGGWTKVSPPIRSRATVA